jgi:hypothetical protein
VAFFSSAALIAGIRSIFHLIWFCAVALFLVWAMREWRKRVVLAVAAPGLLLAAFYGKHFLTFRNFVPGGRVYTGIAAAAMTGRVPRAALEALIASGKITPVLRAGILHFGEDFGANPSDSSLARIVPIPPKTGIPALDECRKSTDSINWNCAWAEKVVQVYARDSLVVFRHYPGAYLRSLWSNVKRYFWPDTREWPFDSRAGDANQRILARPLALYNLFTAAEWPPAIGRPWLTYLLLPGLLGFGLFQALSGGSRDRPESEGVRNHPRFSGGKRCILVRGCHIVFAVGSKSLPERSVRLLRGLAWTCTDENGS